MRKMRRFKQQLSQENCIKILQQEPRGVLSVLGEDGYPYGMPLDHFYYEGKLYFHCAKSGHKLDAIKKYDKVSYCVMDKGYKKPGEWALNIKSVIVFGHIKVVEDHEKVLQICTMLAHKFTDDEDYIANEIKHAGPAVICLELTPDAITGKLVNES